MQVDTYSASLEPVLIGENSEEAAYTYVYGIAIWPASTVILGSVTAVIRWNDGVGDKTKTIVMALTTLNGYQSQVFHICMGGNTTVTLETTLVGSASYVIARGSVP